MAKQSGDQPSDQSNAAATDQPDAGTDPNAGAAAATTDTSNTSDTTTDQATTDQATTDQATTDQATTDQATTDQASADAMDAPPVAVTGTGWPAEAGQVDVYLGESLPQVASRVGISQTAIRDEPANDGAIAEDGVTILRSPLALPKDFVQNDSDVNPQENADNPS